MFTEDFDYYLPKELIAQSPIEPRDQSRLLVMDKSSGNLSHKVFHEIVNCLDSDDVLVLNNTKVLPARLFGIRRSTGGKIEILLLRKIRGNEWEAQVKASGRLHIGEIIDLGITSSAQYLKTASNGFSVIRLSSEDVLRNYGTLPLPPYIKKPLERPDRYQTVYAKHLGSAAAPTAGLHFTSELLKEVKSLGVSVVEVTLHVGVDTFRPVYVKNPENHDIHKEYWHLSEFATQIINNAKAKGGRIICVGTTTVRLLEQAASLSEGWPLVPGSGLADLFILPGFSFKVADGIITNFHLPRSTLLMMISAFTSREKIIAAYLEAIKQRYRFYSFGDAMFIK